MAHLQITAVEPEYVTFEELPGGAAKLTVDLAYVERIDQPLPVSWQELKGSKFTIVLMKSDVETIKCGMPES